MRQLRFLTPSAAAGFITGPRVAALSACRTHTGAHTGPFCRPGRLSAASRPQRTAILVPRRLNLSCRAKRPDITSDLELGRPNENRERNKPVNGIYWILLLNIGVYVTDHVFKLREAKMLYFYHSLPAWYQFVTATFCHANWNHLSSNLFFLYIFGKLVEEEEGNFALWISYILTGAGANLVSWLVLPTSAVSVGASGAVFGLFAISVLVKMSWDWRKILEVLILGQFVIDKVGQNTDEHRQMIMQVLQHQEYCQSVAAPFSGISSPYSTATVPPPVQAFPVQQNQQPHL